MPRTTQLPGSSSADVPRELELELGLDEQNVSEQTPKESWPDGQHLVVKSFEELESQPKDVGLTMKNAIKRGENMSNLQMFNVLLGVLCDLLPTYCYSRGDTLADLSRLVIATRTSWFENITDAKGFWTVLQEQGLPARNHFSIEQRREFEHHYSGASHFPLLELLGWVDSQNCPRESKFPFETGQEIDALQRSASDGCSGKNWRDDDTRLLRIHGSATSPFQVRLSADTEAGLKLLGDLTSYQDADFCYCMLYVLGLLVPERVLAPSITRVQWIDLDDVMEKIGWYPAKLPREKREEQRLRVLGYLMYGDRAAVVGQRTSRYHDRITGEQIPTYIDSPLWRILGAERPVQLDLFEKDERGNLRPTARQQAPRRVQLVLSKEWEPILVHADLRQYLPLAEVVAAIPSGKVAGDWARSMALVQARLWRIKPRETMHGQLLISRRELLCSYTPTTSVEKLLNGSNPKRVIGYWYHALELLKDCRFVSDTDEVERAAHAMLQNHPKYGWQEPWLEEKVLIRPGLILSDAIGARAQALPPASPKRLGTPSERHKKKGNRGSSSE